MKPLEAYFIRLMTVIVATMPSGNVIKFFGKKNFIYECSGGPFSHVITIVITIVITNIITYTLTSESMIWNKLQ